MVGTTGRRMVWGWLSVVAVLAGACKSGDAGTGTSTTTSDASTGTSETASTTSSTGSTSTTGMLPTGTSNAITEAGENGPPCPPGEVTPDTLASGVVGEPYMATITHGLSGTGDASVLGMLPPGIEAIYGGDTIDLTGTPTMAGEFPITILSSTADGGVCLPEKDYVLVIEEGGATGGTGSSTGATGG
jgi:hypothetical protein